MSSISTKAAPQLAAWQAEAGYHREQQSRFMEQAHEAVRRQQLIRDPYYRIAMMREIESLHHSAQHHQDRADELERFILSANSPSTAQPTM